MKIEFSLRLKVSTALVSGHFMKRYIANKHNKKLLRTYWLTIKEKPKAPCKIGLHRIYNPSIGMRAYDDDNLVASYKGVRDIIADLLVPGLEPGQADAAVHGLRWEYGQSKGQPERTMITIEEV